MFSCSKAGGRDGSRRSEKNNAQRPTGRCVSCIGRGTWDVGRWELAMSDPSSPITHLSRRSDAKADKPSTDRHFAWRMADLLVGGLFVYAGVIKILDPVGFANDIDNYRILPWAFSVRLAFYLPW